MPSIELITPADLAALIHVMTSTLAQWRHKGTGPAFTRLGKNIFYPAEKVREWVLDRMGAPKTSPLRIVPAPAPAPAHNTTAANDGDNLVRPTTTALAA